MTLRAVSGGAVDASNLTGVVPVVNGGTGATTLGTKKILLGNGTAAITSMASGTVGQHVVGAGALAPVWANIGDPKFKAQITGNQSVTGATVTTVTFNNEIYDSSSCYDPTTYRFTPNIAGKYNVSVFIQALFTIVGGNQVNMDLLKNGTAIATMQFTSGYAAAQNVPLSTSTIIDMNGTTDFLTVDVSIPGTVCSVTGGVAGSSFQAFYIGP